MTPTSENTLIVMVDDQQERRSKADLLEEQTGYTVRFVSLQNRGVIDELQKAFNEMPEPSMVLVDHILDKAVAGSAVHRGTSIVPLLREKWPRPPIVAVTAAYDDCVNNIDSEVYEDVVPIEWFSKFVNHVPSVIAGYRALGRGPHDLGELLSLFDVPESEKDALGSSLPATLKTSFDAPSYPHRVFRWFRRTFFANAGFLVNRQWAALAIGVSDEHFTDYEAAIAEARYNGIFADSENPRWWKARLYSCVLPDSPRRFHVRLCEAAKEKLQILDDHESRCYRCGERWPEVIGFVDESAIKEECAKPLHLRCSRTHPLSAPVPFYEERRIMLD